MVFKKSKYAGGSLGVLSISRVCIETVNNRVIGHERSGKNKPRLYTSTICVSHKDWCGI